MVETNVYIRSMDDIKVASMEFDTQMTFREEWMDKRLIFDGGDAIPFLIVPDADRVWRPDTFCEIINAWFLNIRKDSQMFIRSPKREARTSTRDR